MRPVANLTPPGFSVPDTYQPEMVARCHAQVIGRPGQRIHALEEDRLISFVADEDAPSYSAGQVGCASISLDIPNVRGIVIVSGCNARAIGRPGNRSCISGMSIVGGVV